MLKAWEMRVWAGVDVLKVSQLPIVCNHLEGLAKERLLAICHLALNARILAVIVIGHNRP